MQVLNHSAASRRSCSSGAPVDPGPMHTSPAGHRDRGSGHEADTGCEGMLATAPTSSDEGGLPAGAHPGPSPTNGVREPPQGRAESMRESIDKGIANKATIDMELAPFYILRPSSTFCTVWDCGLPPFEPGSRRPAVLYLPQCYVSCKTPCSAPHPAPPS
jgi:hypothetical protein